MTLRAKVVASLVPALFILAAYILLAHGRLMFGAFGCLTLGASRLLLGLGINIVGWEESWRKRRIPELWTMEPGSPYDIFLGICLLLGAILLLVLHLRV